MLRLRPKPKVALQPKGRTYNTFSATNQAKATAEDAFLAGARQRAALKASFAKRLKRK